jgi:hypothetical protein
VLKLKRSVGFKSGMLRNMRKTPPPTEFEIDAEIDDSLRPETHMGIKKIQVATLKHEGEHV